MSETEFNFPEWQVPLQELLLEFDREKLTLKMQEMESILQERLQHLKEGCDGHVENDAILDALRILRVVKRDKLGFPDWR